MPYSPTTWIAHVTEITAALMNKIESALQSATSTAEEAAPATRQISAGTGLSGGGDLTQDRTISANIGSTSSSVARGDRGMTPGGTVGQVQVKNSATDYDVSWANQTGGGGGASITAQDEGTTLGTQRTTWNFVGEGLDVTDDPTNTRTQIRGRVTPARGSALPSSPQTNQIAVDTSVVAAGVPKQWDGSVWQTLLQWAGIANVPKFYLPAEFFYAGNVNAKTGVGHDPVFVAGTFDGIWVTADSAPAGGSVTATLVKEAGGPGGTATTIGSVTLAIGSRGGFVTALNTTVAQGDSVRADVTTGSGYTADSCKNLTIKGRYYY